MERIVIIKPTGKLCFGRLRRRYEEHIRIHLKEIGVITRN